MAQFQPPIVFTPGQVLTASDLNGHVSGAIILPGVITDQTVLAALTVASGDFVLLYDSSATALRKTTISDILNSGLSITTGSITGNAGADITLTPGSGYKFQVVGNLDVTGNSTIAGNETITGGLTVTGNTICDAALTVNGLPTFSVTSAMKIPTGTTAQRPGTPVAGQLRYNTTTSVIEIYNGTAWVEEANKTYVDSKPIAKAWVKFAGATGVVADSFNVASVSRTGVGAYTVNLTTGLSNSNFAVLATCSQSSGGASGWTTVTGQTNSSASIYTAYPVSYGGAQLPYDPTSVYLVIFGN